jgi:hypothetical protein
LASSALSSSEALSTTTTSPLSPVSAIASRARATHASMFSSSFRHGMTTDIRGFSADVPERECCSDSTVDIGTGGASLPERSRRAKVARRCGKMVATSRATG